MTTHHWKLIFWGKKPPESVRDFFGTALTNRGRRDSNSVSRLADSFSQDLVHGMTKGKAIMEKHFLIWFGSYNLSGEKNVVVVLNKFGHSLSHSNAGEILTAYAESNIKKSKSLSLLPLQPSNPDEIVLSYFWVDNLDLETDKWYGGGESMLQLWWHFKKEKRSLLIIHIFMYDGRNPAE